MKLETLNLNPTILLTGGLGYIGSHCATVLAQAGYRPVLLDNLSNAKLSVLACLETIIGFDMPFIEADVRDTERLQAVMVEHGVSAVMHFAGLKAVGESVAKPIDYYDNNVGGTVSLLKAMRGADVNTLVFSSSATVYGDPEYLPIDEDHPTGATNPYGRTKLQIEEMLFDVASADRGFKVVSLRYFNPVGAHDSRLIGEDPNDIPNNLMPFIAQVATGQLDKLRVFGNDYDTPDGTGVRDYIHVMDLAEGHLAALQWLEGETGADSMDCGAMSSEAMNSDSVSAEPTNAAAINLGTGQGYSVLEMVSAFEKASGRRVDYQITDRRPGDIASCYANPEKAHRVLGWSAKRGLDEMCQSAWAFQQNLVSQAPLQTQQFSAVSE